MTVEEKLRHIGMLQKLAAFGGLTSGAALSNAARWGADTKAQQAKAHKERLWQAGKWLVPAALGTAAAGVGSGYLAHRMGASPLTSLSAAGLGTLAGGGLAMSAAPTSARKGLFGI